MSKPIIAVDIDDVVSSQTDVLIAFSNKRYGTKLTWDDFMVPTDTHIDYYPRTLHSDPAEGMRRFQAFLDEGHPYKQAIAPETLAALRQLGEHYRLEVVTSRAADFKDGTIAMLERLAPDVFAKVHFMYLWDQPDEKATKAKVCREIGAGYLIDDAAVHCNLAAEAGVHALLFGVTGWNIKAQLHPDVVRVADWPAVLEYFDARVPA